MKNPNLEYPDFDNIYEELIKLPNVNNNLGN